VEKLMKRKTALIIFVALVIVAAVIALVVTNNNHAPAPAKATGYSPQAEQAIKDFTAIYGKDSPNYSGNEYVVTDFDNTTSIFDITYQCCRYQLETMSFALDPEGLEEAIKTGLDMSADDNQLWVDDITAAYEYLYTEYGPFTAAGLDKAAQEKIQKDPQWLEFATKMREFFHHVEDTTPEEINYAWILYWYSGMSREEVYDLFFRSCSMYKDKDSENVKWTSPKEIDSKLGSVECEFNSGTSVPDDVKGMLSAMHDAGIDVWVCSASHLDGVRAAVDAYGLSEYITGVIGMTQAFEDGKYVPAYDYKDGYAWKNLGGGKWEQTEYTIRALPGLEGKVEAIENALVPMYGAGPLAGFMDSSGDFNFCTEFDSLKMVICYNRANRKITEGGGLIAVAAVYQQEALGYDLKKANAAGDTLYLLQGRDENGKRSLRPSNETIRLGETAPRLFANDDNMTLLNYAKEHKLTTAELLNTFAIHTEASDAGNPLGIEFGHLKEYRGYHGVELVFFEKAA
jgi:phosphoglycolate phosphatase-like HAD superfamily hydrolase